MPAPLVRPALRLDLAAVAKLRWDWIAGERSADAEVEESAFVESFAAWAAAHASSHRCFVVEVDGAVVGAGWLATQDRVPSPRSLARRNCDVQSVVVAPAHRGSGAGIALVGRLVEEARAAGAERVVVHSSPEAVALYDRAGFRSSELLRDVDLVERADDGA